LGVLALAVEVLVFRAKDPTDQLGEDPCNLFLLDIVQSQEVAAQVEDLAPMVLIELVQLFHPQELRHRYEQPAEDTVAVAVVAMD
jgi:hypothetical protein